MCVPSEASPHFWDRQASTFDDEPDHGLRDPDVRDAWRRLLRSLLPAPPAAIADLGCGTGSLSLLAATEGYRVTGIDFSVEMVAAAKAKAKATDAFVAASFRQGDVSDPDLAPASLDAIVVRHVTWALPEPATAIRRWARLLREGGRLVLIEGRWSTGAGISSRRLERIVRPILPTCEVQPLTDERLWGGPIDDERYVIVARP